MDVFLQCLVSSISLGAIYSILALAYTILFGTLKTANFTQGDIYMVGMCLGFTFYVTASLPFWLALIAAVVITIIVQLVFERAIYRPILKNSSLYLFITTIGMATFIRNAAQLVFGSEAHVFPPLFGSSPIKITEGVSIMPQNLVIIIVAVILVAALFIFMKKTKTGLAMTSVSMNPFAASMMGVNYGKVTVITYGIAAALCAIAGVFTGPIYTVTTTVGSGIGLKALIAAVLGGFGNTAGAILGGVILGIVETFGATYISSSYKDAFAFIVLIILLFIRPQGILGRKSISKV